MTLEADICAWDGKSRADILAVYARFSDVPDFAQRLTAAASQPDMADGATWMLKHWTEQGGIFPDAVAVIATGAAAQSWPAQLHVLQMLPAMTLTQAERTAAEELAFRAIASDRAMVRAWGYSACDQLGNAFPDLAVRVSALLDVARAEETAGSVRARLKRCRL